MASGSERSGVGVEPNPSHVSTPAMDFNNQFEQQQSAINELKEGLRKNEQQITGKEKELEEYASKLNSIKSRSRASVRSPRPVDKGTGSSELTTSSPKDAEKLTPSKSLVLLRQKVNENKLILEQRGREQVENKRGVAVMVENLKTQLEERDSTIQLLQTKLSSPDVSARLHHTTTHVPDTARKQLDLNEQAKTEVDSASTAQHVRVTELTNKIFDLQSVIVGLQENLLEKDSVINARTRAIALMSEDLCRKGKTTLDQLEETKEEMRLMQNNFVAHETEMNKEKADLCEQLASKDHRLQQLEETNNELAVIRNELTTRVSELQNSHAASMQNSSALAEANKQIVKLKAQTKKQLKQLNSLNKGPVDSNRISDLENKIASLEEEKGNLQLHLVDFDDLKVSESNFIERIAHLEAELESKDSLLEETMLKLAMLPALESEKNALEERIASITNQLQEIEQHKVLAELKSVQLEEDIDIMTKEKANLEDMLVKKTAELEYVPQCVTNIMATQTVNGDVTETCTQTLFETMDMAIQTLDDIVFEVSEPEAEQGNVAGTLQTVEAAIQTVELEILELATGFMALERKKAAASAEATALGQKYASVATQTLEQSRSTVFTQTKKQAADKPSVDIKLMEKKLFPLLGSSSVDECIQQIKQLKSDHDHFQAKISDYQTTMSAKESELLAFQKEMEETRVELEARMSELVSKDERIKTLSANIQTLEASLEQKNAALHNLTAKHSTQLDKIKKLAANLKARTLQLKSYEENVKVLQTTINDKDNYISKLKIEKEAMNVARQEISTNRQELLAEWEVEKLKLEDFTHEYHALQQQFHQFKGQSALQLTEAENTILAVTSQLSMQKEQLDQFKSVLQQSEGYIATLLQERESHDKELKLSRSSIGEENAKHLKQIAELEKIHASCEMTAKTGAEHRSRLEGYLNQAQTLIVENEGRFQQILAANEAKLYEKEAVCEALDSDLNKTRDRVQRLEKTLDDNQELRKQLRAENESLRIKYQESERSVQDASSVQFSLEQRLAELLANIEALRKKLQYEEESGKESNETVLELQSQVTKLEKTLGTAQNKLDTLRAENDRLTSLEREYLIACDKVNTLEGELKRSSAGFEQESNQLIEELQKSSTNLESICSRFDQCDGERRALAAKCDQLTDEKHTMEREVEELNSTAVKQSTQIEELMVCIQDMERAWQHSKKDTENWMVTEQALHSQLSEAMAKYEQLKALLSESGALKEVCRKEVSSIISAAQAHVLVQPDEAEQGWGWGSEDVLLEEQHQNQTSNSVTLLETEISELEAQKAQILDDLKNAQLFSGKLVKKVKELKSSNETLSSQLKATSNSLDQTMEIEFASQISSLEKEVLALKAEKDTIVSENHKMNTKLEGLLWQLSELKEDKARLAEEVDWNNKALLEKESKLTELNRIINTATDEKTTMTSDETFVEISADLEESKDLKISDLEMNLTTLHAEFSNINCHCENVEHELEAREMEILDLKATVFNTTNELHQIMKVEQSLNEEIDSLKLDLSSRVYETNRLSHVLLEQEKNLLEVNSKFLARDRDGTTLETLVEMKNAEIQDLTQELKEHLNVIHLLKAVQNDPSRDRSQSSSTLSAPSIGSAHSPSFNDHRSDDERDELDHALYRLHQKEVRCDELTIELMQLLEERDTLQLRLSVALRMNEEMKNSSKLLAKSAVDQTAGESSPENNPSGQTSADLENRPEVLANKLDQLRSVGREQRQMALQQQQRGDVAIDANYTMPREPENEQESFFEWIWGRSTPKVMHI